MKEKRLTTFQEFSQLFFLDEESPSGLRWRITPFKKAHPAVGDVVGTLNAEGYWYLRYKENNYGLHRVVWCLLNEADILSGQVIDHINGDGSDNSHGNLRCVTQKENARNRTKQKNNTSGVTGVVFWRGVKKQRGDYWTARWRVDGKNFVKYFIIDKNNPDQAFKDACTYREEILATTLTKEEGYTERHGK